MQAVLAELRASELGWPLVVKADGLAAGKGAAVCEDALDGEEAIVRMREAGALSLEDAEVTVVLEEFLSGVEVSALAFTDGIRVAMMPPSCDHKRLNDGDKGPMTGGMGAYAPTNRVTPELWQAIEREVIQRVVDGMRAEGIPYKGVLYAGLMLTEDGPKVLEFNCRFGDPETQVLLPLLKTPLEDIALAVANGDLASAGPIEWSDESAVGVVVASQAYPIGKSPAVPVTGLDDMDEGVRVFHAGTQALGSVSLRGDELSPVKRQSLFKTLFSRDEDTLGPSGTFDMQLLASGGRLLTLVATGRTLKEARDKVYANIGKVKIAGAQWRSDIGAGEE